MLLTIQQSLLMYFGEVCDVFLPLPEVVASIDWLLFLTGRFALDNLALASTFEDVASPHFGCFSLVVLPLRPALLSR
jgi:hypothetical protein